MTGPASRVCCVLALLLCAGAAPVDAQRTLVSGRANAGSEMTRLREAAAFEERGDFRAAQRMVESVLEANPRSLTALLTLERLLEIQGRMPEIEPAVDRLLERDPTSVVGHQLRLRLYDELNDPDALERSIQQWTRATPHLETPYREGALAWRSRNEHGRAVALLERGRGRIERPDALALELGDAYADAGDAARAAEEWSRAIGPEGRGFNLVQRRLQQLSDGGAAILPLLVDRLTGPPVSDPRQKAAAMLAIDAGMDARALRAARELAGRVQGRQRENLLVEIARRADGARLHEVGLWAYRELLAQQQESGAALAIRTRIAELALLTGDTAAAAATYRELEEAAAPGSPQRGQALALRIQLSAREGELDEAAAGLAALRAEYPQAAELDATATAVALLCIEANDIALAEKVLTGIHGPQSARVRGRIHLRRGDLESARQELLGAAPLLQGAEATEVIVLARLLTRVSPEGGELVTSVSAAPAAGRASAIREAASAAARLEPRERSAILEFLAGSADRAGLAADADAIRYTMVNEGAHLPEAPAALLALAVRAAERDDGADEAIVLLEKLIMEYPRSALLPRARNELQRVGRGSTR
jgi:hypothetical protein